MECRHNWRIQTFKTPFEYLVIDDFYDDRELQGVWSEIDFLTPNLVAAADTGSATANGEILKRGQGVFLDEIYAARQFSMILKLNRKLFSPPVISAMEPLHPFYKSFKACNRDTTLLNLYGESGAYIAHFDEAVFSAVTFLYKEPKGFEGGEFRFPEYNLTLEPKNNRLVLFPSGVLHEVLPIRMATSDIRFGRYSLAQFIFFS